MTVDKRMSYEMQGGKKPARNYLGKQKTVSNVPVKWKSGPDTPETELAYITKAEKDLLLKKNLHGSLKNGPNTGPDGIMSLDSQGDYTRDRSPGAYGGGSRQSQAQNEQNMREILTGQKNIGQTAKTGPKTKQYSNLPEYMKVKQPDGTYKNKYIGSAYKSYGQPSFWGNLFSRGAPGYRGIKGLSAFGTPMFEATQGPDGLGYYTDDTDFGETRGAMPFGIMGIIANAINKFKKPKDMSQYNKLQLVDGELVDDPRIDKIPVPGESAWSDGTFTWGGTTPTTVSDRFKYGVGPVPLSDPFANSIGPRAVNIPAGDAVSSNTIPTVNGVPMIDTGSVYQDNLDFFENLNQGIVEGNRVPLLPDANVMQGSVVDMATAPIPKADPFRKNAYLGDGQYDQLEVFRKSKNPLINYEGLYEDPDRFLETADRVDRTGQSDNWFNSEIPVNARARADNRAYNRGRPLPSPYGERSYYFDDFNPRVGTPELTAEEQLDMGLLPDPFSPFKDGGRVGYANGGLASLFTRRG